jgi:thymidylate kinase
MLVSRKPFMVEFSGTPEAGKTTTINTVANIMRNANYRVIVLRESAESLPDEIAKGTFQANMWMHFITQAGLLKAVHADADIALIDRGIVDSEFYGQKFLLEGGCSKDEYEEFERTFLQCLKPDLFITLMVTPEEAIKRRGGEGRLVNREYVRKYNEAYLKYFRKVQYPKELINTEMKEPSEVSKQVSNIILNYYR